MIVNANLKNYANLALIIVRNEIFIPLWSLLEFIATGLSTSSKAVNIYQADHG